MKLVVSCDTFLTSVFLVLSPLCVCTCVRVCVGLLTRPHSVSGVSARLSCPLKIGSLSLEGVAGCERGLH